MSGIYIHIPFCRQSCVYCNFYFRNGKQQAEEITNSIIKEIELRVPGTDTTAETIYFGGGTPSFIAPELIANILDKTAQHFNILKDAEITLEANPDDINEANLDAWKLMGINRLSIGVQSFFDDELKWMNRAHNAREAENAIKMSINKGFEISIDLIFGIPVSNMDKWSQNLEKANSFDIAHLSCYSLTLEDHTAWKKLIELKKYASPDEEMSAAQFDFTMEYLTSKGWLQYEISNYCRPGKMAKHNTAYWQDKPYFGLGPSAHSYDGTSRSWNVADIDRYISSVKDGKPEKEEELLGIAERHNEYIMTGLRTIWGIDPEKLSLMNSNNPEIKSRLENYVTKGLIRISSGNYVLSREGRSYADSIASDLFIV